MLNLIKLFKLNDLNDLKFRKPEYANTRIAVKGNRRSIGPAYVERYGNIFSGYFEGSDYDMGYQHGRLLKDEIHQGVIPYLYHFVEILLNQVFRIKVLKDVIKFLSRKFFYERIVGRIPENILHNYIGLADGAGFDRNSLYAVVGFADMLQVASGIINRSYRLLSLPPIHLCTSIVAYGSATKTGKLMHSRNLDYEAYQVWERYPLIARVSPESGIPYIFFSSAGVHSGGLTGINDYGVAFNVHTNFTSRVGFWGPPMQVVGDYILRNSKNLNEAERIIKQMRFNCGWTFVISCVDGLSVKAFEVDSKYIRDINSERDYLVTTNCYKNHEMKKGEISINRTMDVNFVNRLKRAEELVCKYYSRIDEQILVDILSDNYSLCERGYQYEKNTIAQMSTIQSVVMNVSDRVFYIADGRSPVCYGRYYAFDSELRPLISGRRQVYIQRSQRVESSKLKALRLYLNAAYLHNIGNEKEISAYLREAVRVNPDSHFYMMMYAFFLTKEKRYKEAQEILNRALSLVTEREDNLYRIMLYRLFKGRLYDLQGFRSQAKAIYKEIVKTDGIDYRIINAARLGLRRRYSESSLNGVIVNFFTADFMKL